MSRRRKTLWLEAALVAFLFLLVWWRPGFEPPPTRDSWPPNLNIKAGDLLINGVGLGMTRQEVGQRFAAYRDQPRQPSLDGWLHFGITPGGLGYHDCTEIRFSPQGTVEAVAG
ncbi:MAG: hypothetical protein AB1758_36690, partial [Candidatus Eremiobacterota bacterium]